MHFISQALLANFVYKKEIDYTLTTSNGVKSITIIDTFTGRLQHGRRFNDGLHTALEAKHLRDGVTIQDESTTVATITLQNFFRLYDNLAGMSGTVHEEQSEFMEIYNLPVIVVPPHQPDIREDMPVMFFKDTSAKWGKVIDLVEKYHKEKDPVLISTTSVEDSILISKLLKERKLKHKVLNAKQDAQEAKIISKAGDKYKITVATNMAGRGTDIKVDPNLQLVIIMTELNDASRIDRQLKGRTGRQGARGTIYTVISADDTIFRKTNTCDRLKKLDMSTKQIEKFIDTVQEELEMKPIGVEYLFDGEKVVCYFSADDRVDFRQLVRELSHELHERIDMRQIGVREEAAVIGGYGHCGQELCCRRFGLSFEPVSIRMAKEQDLPLNSTKISGACGRLMCCLRYEFEAYRDFKNRAPKRNAVIETPLGMAKIVEYNTPKEEIALRLESGKVVRIPLADMDTSPAAQQKSEDLGCSCRPDSVSRTALERLESVEVQMALAELDRANGLIVDEEPEINPDLFVTETPRRKRERSEQSSANRQENAKNSAARNAREEQGAQSSSRTRRVRTSKNAQVNPGSSTFDASTDTLRRTRRRHHATEEGAANTQAPQKNEQGTAPAQKQPQGKRFRRTDAPQAPQKADEAQAPVRAKRTRRPGDRAGMKTQSASQNTSGSNGAPNAASRDAQPQNAARRRHRRAGRDDRGRGSKDNE